MSPTDDQSPPPKLFDHCITVFNALRRGAVSVKIPDGGGERHALVYEGHTTKLFRELGLPSPYYTHVMRQLRLMRCVTQLSRGGGGSPSRWELLADPDLGAFHEATKKARANPSRLAIVEKDVRDLHERMRDMETSYQLLITALQDREKASGQ